jgi:hypothetical protein
MGPMNLIWNIFQCDHYLTEYKKIIFLLQISHYVSSD